MAHLTPFFRSFVSRITIVAALLLFGCGDAFDELECPVPMPDARFETPVIEMKPSDMMFAKKVSGFGYKQHGLILFRDSYGDVHAFDRTCPDSEACINSGVVEPELSKPGSTICTGYAVCARCSAKYSLVDGRSTSRKICLRPYRVYSPIAGWYKVSNN